MRILCTGAGGAIGGHLVARLLADGHEVMAVDIKLFPEWWQLHDGAENKSLDLRDSSKAWLALHEPVWGFDRVYQLAASMGGMGFLHDHDAEIIRDNTLININMIEAAKRAKAARFLFSSSACVYPVEKQTGDQIFTVRQGKKFAALGSMAMKESDVYPASPQHSYGWEKLHAEHLCKYYQEVGWLDTRVARFHNCYGPCFDDQTEILTKEGFKLFANLTFVDEVLTMNPKSKMAEYQNPIGIQRHLYRGEMIDADSRTINFSVTPDHSLYFSKVYHAEPIRREADSILGRSNSYFSRFVNWIEDDGLDYVQTLRQVKRSDGRCHDKRGGAEKCLHLSDWLSFLGWYLSEGSAFRTKTNYTVAISQYDKENQKEIVSLIKRMGFNCSIDSYGRSVIICSKQLYEILHPFGRSHDKFIPRKYMLLPQKYLRFLFDSLMKGDGTKSGSSYSSVSKQLADDVQELAIKLGLGASLTVDKGGVSLVYRVNICTKTTHRVRKKYISTKSYDGMVYDVTVPNHIILVRRKGKLMWSGNCGSWNDGREKAPAALCRKVAQAKKFCSYCFPGRPDLNVGAEIEIWGDGTAIRSFMHVDDCVEGLIRLMESDHHEPLNIGRDRAVNISELADIIIDIAGMSGKIKKVYVDGPVGVQWRNSDNSKCREVLGWEPTIPIEEGLIDTYQWVEEQVLGAGCQGNCYTGD